jgi:osmotically-inducible protein OsmY
MASNELTTWLIRKELSMGSEVISMVRQKTLVKMVGALMAVGLLSAAMMAETSAASRYDDQIQTTVTQKLAAKRQLSNVKANVADGIVTLTGTVDLYQGKLDAAKVARKAGHAQGVRNLVSVAGPNVPDAQLEQKLAKKLRYVRLGYDITFDYFALGVKDGVVTVEGQDRTGLGRDEALYDIANMPGVKDVIDNISIEPVSQFDDGLRLRALRVIYGDTVLSRYAIDPARPIRIIVDNGHLTLYGSVDSKMDKEVAGIRANQLFGAFSVDNKLQVEGKGQQGL